MRCKHHNKTFFGDASLVGYYICDDCGQRLDIITNSWTGERYLAETSMKKGVIDIVSSGFNVGRSQIKGLTNEKD